MVAHFNVHLDAERRNAEGAAAQSFDTVTTLATNGSRTAHSAATSTQAHRSGEHVRKHPIPG